MNELTPAQKEAYARVSATQGHVAAVEFRHPVWSDPIRLVQSRNSRIVLLENEAPVNASEAVIFTPFGFSGATPPTVSIEPDSNLTMRLDGVSGLVQPLVSLALSTAVPIDLTLREIFVNTLDAESVAEVLAVYHLEVRDVQTIAESVQVKAGYRNLKNVAFPSVLYSESSNPSLAA